VGFNFQSGTLGVMVVFNFSKWDRTHRKAPSTALIYCTCCRMMMTNFSCDAFSLGGGRMRQMIDAKRLVHDKFKRWFMCHEASTSQVGSVCDSCLICSAYLLARMPEMKSAMLRKCSPQGLQGLRLRSRTDARPSLWNSTDKSDQLSMKVDRS
jgi:hypothetical protein